MSQQIGFFREITPCPSSGKITFQQIGAIRQITKNISCDNEELLLARKPRPTGELDGANNPIYALAEPTYDPSDYYSAYWGASYDLIKGESLGPNPLGDWNEQFVDPQPPDDYQDIADGAGGSAEAKSGYRGVASTTDTDGNSQIELTAASGGVYSFYGWQGTNAIYAWDWYQRTVYAISYISRAQAGDRLVFYFESAGTEGSYMRVIGWRDGWMGNDEKEYASVSTRTGRAWRSYIVGIGVGPSYRDIAIAFYQSSSSSDDYFYRSQFKNVHCWRA